MRPATKEYVLLRFGTFTRAYDTNAIYLNESIPRTTVLIVVMTFDHFSPMYEAHGIGGCLLSYPRFCPVGI